VIKYVGNYVTRGSYKRFLTPFPRRTPFPVDRVGCASCATGGGALRIRVMRLAPPKGWRLATRLGGVRGLRAGVCRGVGRGGMGSTAPPLENWIHGAEAIKPRGAKSPVLVFYYFRNFRRAPRATKRCRPVPATISRLASASAESTGLLGPAPPPAVIRRRRKKEQRGGCATKNRGARRRVWFVWIGVRSAPLCPGVNWEAPWPASEC